MTLIELMDREKCTTEERESVIAYYLAIKILPILPIVTALFTTSKLFK